MSHLWALSWSFCYSVQTRYKWPIHRPVSWAGGALPECNRAENDYEGGNNHAALWWGLSLLVSAMFPSHWDADVTFWINLKCLFCDRKCSQLCSILKCLPVTFFSTLLNCGTVHSASLCPVSMWEIEVILRAWEPATSCATALTLSVSVCVCSLCSFFRVPPDVQELPGCCLVLHGYDWDRFKTDDFIGKSTSLPALPTSNCLAFPLLVLFVIILLPIGTPQSLAGAIQDCPMPQIFVATFQNLNLRICVRVDFRLVSFSLIHVSDGHRLWTPSARGFEVFVWWVFVMRHSKPFFSLSFYWLFPGGCKAIEN